MKTKNVYIIAGPNGSGKTTFAKELIKELRLPFVNADEIAFEMSPEDLAKARLKAGKAFFGRIDKYIQGNKSFVVETTLAGRYWINLLRRLRRKKYRIALTFIFVESVQEAVRRIDIRVKKGGHSVPVEDIKRRFKRSLANFWNIYRREADHWEVFLNSKDEFLQVAAGSGQDAEIIDEKNFNLLKGAKA